MPDREQKPLNVNNGKAVQSENPHQSTWLTHWTGTGFDASPSTHDPSTQLSRSRVDYHDLNDHDIKKPKPHIPIGVEIASDNFGSSKGIKDVDLAISLKKPKPHIPIGVERASDNFGSSKGIKDVDLAISLKKPISQSFPFFKIGQESGSSSISKDEGLQALEPKVGQVSVFQPEGVSQMPTEQVKYHMFFGESSYPCSRPSNDKFGSASRINTTHGPENCQLTALYESKEPKTSSTIMEHEKPEMPSFLRHNKIDSSTSSNHSPAFIEEQYQRMQKHIRMGFFPNQTGSQESTKSAAIHHGPCSFQNLPHFVHDVETTRICTPLEGLAGGLHSFSRTTHSLLITKQTDLNLYQENQILRESRVSTRFKGKAHEELQYSPLHFANTQRGVKLQLLGSSSDRESENDVKTAENVQKNESSADTDAMDMESFKEMNYLSGVHSSRSNKDVMVDSNLPPIASPAKKDTQKKKKIELPDINLELSSSADKAEPSPSRTQSLDMNTIHFNLDPTNNSKSADGSETNPGPDPENRWIKRLKLSGASSSLALGTKSSKLAEPKSSAHGKLNKFFKRVTETKPEPEPEREPDTDNCDHKGSETCKDIITLSHSWIQRWSRKNPEVGESCGLGNGKLAVEELQKKKFPSMAAMALMGKTMTGFQRCEFQKKESFVVWNTKGF